MKTANDNENNTKLKEYKHVKKPGKYSECKTMISII